MLAASPLRLARPASSIEKPPTVALVLDVLRGVVHQIDPFAGRSLGTFGEGRLVRPTAIEADPRSGIVYVAGANAIHRFDARTGAEIGAPLSAPGEVAALRFTPQGELFLAVCEEGRYRVLRVEPRGIVLARSRDYGTDGHLSLGLRPDGRVEILNSLGVRTFADQLSADLAHDLGGPFVEGADLAAFRASTDLYLRHDGRALRAGWAKFVGGEIVYEAAPVQDVSFAEGPDRHVYALAGDTLLRVDATTAKVVGLTTLADFPRGPLGAMAVVAS